MQLSLNQLERLEPTQALVRRDTDDDLGPPGPTGWCTTVRIYRGTNTKNEEAKRQTIPLTTLFRKGSKLDEMKPAVWGYVQSRQNPRETQGSRPLRSQGRGCLWGREGLRGASRGGGHPLLLHLGGGYMGFLSTVTGYATHSCFIRLAPCARTI